MELKHLIIIITFIFSSSLSCDFDVNMISPSIFGSFFVFPSFKHTVYKANIPEMITEDYFSDVEEGILFF